MHSAVQRRANHVRHRPVDDCKLPVATGLDVLDLGHQNPGVARDLPARLDDDRQARIGKQRNDGLGVVGRQRTGARLVVGGVSASDVQGANIEALPAQALYYFQRLDDGLDVRVGRVDGGSDVDMDAVQHDVLVVSVLLEEPNGSLDVHAELRLLLARGRVCVRFGVVDVGVQPECRVRRGGGRGRQAREILELRLRLDIEHADTRGDSVGDLPVGLAHACEDDLCHIPSGFGGSGQLAAAGHVERAALGGQERQNVQVRQ